MGKIATVNNCTSDLQPKHYIGMIEVKLISTLKDGKIPLYKEARMREQAKDAIAGANSCLCIRGTGIN